MERTSRANHRFTKPRESATSERSPFSSRAAPTLIIRISTALLLAIKRLFFNDLIVISPLRLVRDRNGETPLHYAVMLGQATIAQSLLEYVPTCTPLHAGLSSHRHRSCSFIRYGADKTIQNAKGQSPLDIAQAENREELVELIQTWSMNGQERTEVSRSSRVTQSIDQEHRSASPTHFL
jgi:hypothetical protein